MGRVYLCLGKNAEVPWYFERARVHIWNVEELCYFVQENAWLLEPEVLDEKLAAWVGEQCGLPDLARQLFAATREKDPVAAFVGALLDYTGYCTKQQEQQHRQQHNGDGAPDAEGTAGHQRTDLVDDQADDIGEQILEDDGKPEPLL